MLMDKMVRYILTGFVFLSMLQDGLQGQNTLDTLYPGYDFAITKMESARREVVPGEGVMLHMTIKNIGAWASQPARINYWVLADDDGVRHPDDILTVKNLMELEPGTYVEFNKLVVIPEEYVGQHVYIIAEVDVLEAGKPDPTPNNNIRLVGLKIGDPRTYKDGMYAFDAGMTSLRTFTQKEKMYRLQESTIEVQYVIQGSRPSRGGHFIEIILSKDKTLDGSDSVIKRIPIERARNGEVELLRDYLIIGPQFAKGRAYLFARIDTNKWFDPEPGNNMTGPVRIKIKK